MFNLIKIRYYFFLFMVGLRSVDFFNLKHPHPNLLPEGEGILINNNAVQ